MTQITTLVLITVLVKHVFFSSSSSKCGVNASLYKRTLTLTLVVQTVPESQHGEESTALIKLPEKSPFKSAMVDHTRRSKSPSPKRVAFAEVCPILLLVS